MHASTLAVREIYVYRPQTLAKLDLIVANRMLSQGHTVREVAARFGVTPQAVYWHIGQQHLVGPKVAA